MEDSGGTHEGREDRWSARRRMNGLLSLPSARDVIRDTVIERLALRKQSWWLQAVVARARSHEMSQLTHLWLWCTVVGGGSLLQL